MLSYCCHCRFRPTVCLGAHGKCGSLGCSKPSSPSQKSATIQCEYCCEQKLVSRGSVSISDMSSDGCHPDGPDTNVFVSLHKVLQAGQGTNASSRHVGELQLCLPRLPSLHGALLLTRLGGRLLQSEIQAVAVAQAVRWEDGRGRGEVAREGLFRVSG